MTLHFLRPEWFWMLLPTSLIFLLLIQYQKKKSAWSSIVDEHLQPFVIHRKKAKSQGVFWVLGGLWLCSIFILAGPSTRKIETPVYQTPISRVIVFDLSSNMLVEDLKPNRLTVAQLKLREILSRAKNTQTALVVYSSKGFHVTPLTSDVETIMQHVSSLHPAIMPIHGDNPGSGLKKAYEIMKQNHVERGQIILITATQQAASSLSLAKDIASDGFSISILGVGTTQGGPQKNLEGNFVYNAQQQIQFSKMNPSELMALARAGKGDFALYQPSHSDIEQILSMQKSSQSLEETEKRSSTWEDQGRYGLIFLLPFVLLSFRRGWLLSFAISICFLTKPAPVFALSWEDLWQDPNEQAYQLLEDGHPDQAAEKFTDSNWKAMSYYRAENFESAANIWKFDASEKAQYNLGNTLAFQGKFNEAIVIYQAVLEKNPEHEDAKFNKELIEEFLAQQQKNQEKTKDNSQDGSNQDPGAEQNEQSTSKGNDKSGEQDDTQYDTQYDNNKQPSQQENTANDNAAEISENGSEQMHDNQDKENLDSRDLTENASSETENMSDSEEISQNELDPASEALLRRIPDNPAGLLKAKLYFQHLKQD